MKARRSILLQLLALALAVAMSLAVLPFLGRAVPIHWNLQGQADAWGSPAFALLLGPAVLAGVVGTSFALLRRPGAGGQELFLGMAVVAGFFLAEHGLVLGATLRHGLFPVRPLLALVFGLFAGLAPIMGRVEQNPWFGVRTPWTLGSRRVWRATHRATARIWLVGGLLGAAMTLFVPFIPLILYLVALAFAPVAVSYRIWLKMGRP